MSDPVSAEDVRAEIAEVLAGHHCRMRKKGPIECWSTLDDQECGLRFTTGGQYRAHVAEVLAKYVFAKQVEAWDAGVRQQYAAEKRVEFNPYRIAP